MDTDALKVKAALVRLFLEDKDRLPKYQGSPNKLYGHCYVACEAFYHLLSKEEQAQFRLKWVKHEGETHFFLERKDGTTVDITVEQFKKWPNYFKGRGCGFLTKKPSKRTQNVLDRIANY